MTIFDKCSKCTFFISQTRKEDDMYSIMNVLVTDLYKDECTKNKWFHRINFVVSWHTTSRNND